MVLIVSSFIAVVFLLIILSWVWPPDSPWAPWWRTNKKIAIAICNLADIKKTDIVYDLGCGDGELLVIAAEKFGASGVGIEIDPLRFSIATLRVKFGRLSKKLKIKKGNFFKEDLSKASVIIVYLVPKTLNQLLPKFRQELKKGTRIISFRYEMNLPALRKDKKNNLYLYKI